MKDQPKKGLNVSDYQISQNNKRGHILRKLRDRDKKRKKEKENNTRDHDLFVISL